MRTEEGAAGARAKLTDKLVRAASPPPAGRNSAIIYDGEVKGFGLRVTRNGARSFVLNYRIAGRERRLTIGSYPDWTVLAAREEAKRLKRLVDTGHDPLAERIAVRQAPRRCTADTARSSASSAMAMGVPVSFRLPVLVAHGT